MPRFAIGVEYDGTDFLGWQHQRLGRTVQAVLGAAVSSVAGDRVSIHVAGRTDTGVHASYQVVHFDSVAERTERQWLLGINSNLPQDVSVNWVRRVPSQFDARRSALSRRYRYLIQQGDVRWALAHRRLWWVRRVLDRAAMTIAATRLLGENDFSSFRAAGCQSNLPMRNLHSIALHFAGDVVALDFTANAYLYHMVRNLVGLLVDIGLGKHDPDWAAEVLSFRDRTRAAATAPAAGLSLVDIQYPAEFGLPPARETLLVV